MQRDLSNQFKPNGFQHPEVVITDFNSLLSASIHLGECRFLFQEQDYHDEISCSMDAVLFMILYDQFWTILFLSSYVDILNLLLI